MALAPTTAAAASEPKDAAGAEKSVSAALALLASLRPRIREVLGAPGDGKLRVALERMDVTKPERVRGEEGVYGRVLWVGPEIGGGGDGDAKKLKLVCGMSSIILLSYRALSSAE